MVAPVDRTIPIQTPFTLTGTATDVDPGDNARLVYLWEQNDTGSVSPTGGTALVSDTKIDGPLFRVFGAYADVSSTGTLQQMSPGENLAGAATASRTFPDLAQVLSDNTNAETGTCPDAPAIPTPATGRSNVPLGTVECFSEFLPTADYGAPVAGLPSAGGTLHFRLTARDLFPTGGGTQYDDVALTVDATTGPFEVTSRSVRGAAAAGGAQETVTWDVNGTDAAALAPAVRISVSTDGGRTFTPVLLSTPNDGSEAITLPDVSTTTARIKVEAVDNYFFDVNDADFTIIGPAAPGAPGSTPGVSGTPGIAGTTLVRTKTRIRLPRPVQVKGAKPVRLLFQVTGATASGARAGAVVVRVDGKRLRRLGAAVTIKRGRTVTGFSITVPRTLSLGKHRFVATFRPDDAAAYAPSRSRRITLTVVRR